MPDYNETTLSGSSWQRCHEVSIANTRNTLPVIQFYEERVIALEDGAEIRQPLGALTVPFDSARVIPLRDPITGEATGDEMTYAQAYAVLYSAYLEAALARDAALPPPPDAASSDTPTE